MQDNKYEELNSINSKPLADSNLEINPDRQMIKPLQYQAQSYEKLIAIFIWLSGYFILQGFVDLKEKGAIFLIIGAIIFVGLLTLAFKKSQYIMNHSIEFANAAITYSILCNTTYYMYKYFSYYFASWYIIKLALMILFGVFLVLSIITPIIVIICIITNNTYKDVVAFKFFK